MTTWGINVDFQIDSQTPCCQRRDINHCIFRAVCRKIKPGHWICVGSTLWDHKLKKALRFPSISPSELKNKPLPH